MEAEHTIGLLPCLQIVFCQVVFLHELFQPALVNVTGVELTVQNELSIFGLSRAIGGRGLIWAGDVPCGIR